MSYDTAPGQIIARDNSTLVAVKFYCTDLPNSSENIAKIQPYMCGK